MENDHSLRAPRIGRRRRANRCSAFLTASLVLGCAGGPSVADGEFVEASSDADSVASSALVGRRIPGLAVAVMKGDDVVFARGYGVLEAGRGSAVVPTSVFQLGSISKQFLAGLVLRLTEQGRLSLDDPVAERLPRFTRLPADLKIRDLLNHTSGIREPFSIPEYRAGIEDLGRPVEELVGILAAAPVDFPPTSRWSYSNANYMILALLVEQSTGMPYEQAMAAELFEPLRLSSLRHCAPLPRDPEEARGHVLNGDAAIPAAPENMNWIRGDGGLCGDALDVARWMRLLATGRVVSPASYGEMTTPTRLGDGGIAEYGFGLSLAAPDGQRKVSHNGAMLGFSASAAYYPEAELTVVVLTNLGDVRSESIERKIARRFLELPMPDLRSMPLAEQERLNLLGTYDIGVFSVRVVDRDGVLWLEAPPPGPTMPLRHLGGGLFVDDTDPYAGRAEFTRAEGSAGSLRLFMGGMNWLGRKE